MNDPGSAISAPPPRYLLESDSSDEEGQGEYAASSSRRAVARNQPSISVRLEWVKGEGKREFKEAVIGLGQAGRYLRRKTGSGNQDVVRVLKGDEEVGNGWLVDGALVLGMEDTEGEVAWKVAECLIKEIGTARLTTVTAYVPAMYIPDPDNDIRSGSDAPIRCLDVRSSRLKGIASWESPNYTTGLAGALVSMAAHPSSPLKSESLSTLLLPLPLSGLSTSDLISALDSISSTLSQSITTGQKSNAKNTKWDETDDEPYSAPGMGGGRKVQNGTRGKKLDKEEVSSMYM